MAHPIFTALSVSCFAAAAGCLNAQTSDNPARQRFNPAITFHLSFEYGLGAELAKGKSDPRICPQQWVRSENENYFFPAKIMSNSAMLQFGRQGRLKEGRQDMVYLWAKLAETKELLVGGGGSLAWRNDEWHLWVMNWRANAVEFSMDGGPLNRADTPVRFNPQWNGSGHSHLLVGCQDATAQYSIDEVMVLNRPLTEEEVKWMYAEGMKVKR